MGNKKHIVSLDKYEQGIAIAALNDKRNELIKRKHSTDAVDDLLLKIIDAPLKKVRNNCHEAR